eukprot:13135887-Ditylum_brightwellii.AAC.1
MTPHVKILLDTTHTNSNKCLHPTFIAPTSENEAGSIENSTYEPSSETDSDEDTISIGSSQLEETDVLNFIGTMPLNNEDSNDFNIFNDIEKHLKCIGHLDI